MIRKIPAGNTQLSAAILYAGAMPTKVIWVLTLKCETILADPFQHQRDYLQATVSRVEIRTDGVTFQSWQSTFGTCWRHATRF